MYVEVVVCVCVCVKKVSWCQMHTLLVYLSLKKTLVCSRGQQFLPRSPGPLCTDTSFSVVHIFVSFCLLVVYIVCMCQVPLLFPSLGHDPLDVCFSPNFRKLIMGSKWSRNLGRWLSGKKKPVSEPDRQRCDHDDTCCSETCSCGHSW